MRKSLTTTMLGVVLLLTVPGCSALKNDTAAPAAGASGGTLTTDGCTDPSAVTKKITDTVTVGWAVPLSGPFAGVWNLIDDAFRARMDQFNADGGAGGVKVKVIFKDSKQNPEVAKAMGNELMQKDGADILGTTGSGQIATMIDDLSAACVPMVAAASNSDVYRDATKYPWATMYLPSVQVEANAIVTSTLKKYPKGATVAIAYSSGDSGAAYVKAFEKATKGTSLRIVSRAGMIDPNAAATTMKASGAQVLFSGAVASECLALTKAIGRIGWKPGEVFQNLTCSDAALFAPAGADADGQQVFKYEIIPTSADFAAKPAVVDYLKQARAQGLADPNSSWSVTGWSTGDIYADVLTRAAASKDGLSRLSIMQAARDQDFHPGSLIDGIDFDVKSGGVNGMQPFRWDAAQGRFVLDGTPIPVTSSK